LLLWCQRTLPPRVYQQPRLDSGEIPASGQAKVRYQLVWSDRLPIGQTSLT
jgi:hypothetical protein